MLVISDNISISEHEVVITAARAQGPGGQHVNTSSTAVHLRFDIQASSLPDFYKKRLLNLRDSRISADGVVVIKAQGYRSQRKNREDAMERLASLVRSVKTTPKKRIKTRPSLTSKKKRLEQKTQRSQVKKMRRKPDTRDD